MTNEHLAQIGSDTSSASDFSSPMSSLPSIASPLSSREFFPLVASAADAFTRGVARSRLPNYAAHVSDSFDEALAQSSPITMLPNYEISPSGDECGDFLVVDLGGSTLRVAVISIAKPKPECGPRQSCKSCETGSGPQPGSEQNKNPIGIFEYEDQHRFRESRESREGRVSLVISRSWRVENSHKVVNRAFFAWIADKIAETLAAQNVVRPNTVITTGITWSFPLESTSYNTAKIFHLAKGFVAADDIVGCELKTLLESTVQEKHGLTLDVQSIINDSLAVFSAARFFDPTTSLAMVLGTGLNFCCQLAASDRIAASKLLHDEKFVLFNTETSLFGHALIPDLTTRYDSLIDARFANRPSFLPHMAVDPKTHTIFQPFELLTSGRYLPELVRLVLWEAVGRKEIFASQKNFDALASPFQGVTGELMCFLADCTNDYAMAERIESCFRWPQSSVSLADAASCKLLVTSVIKRAAYVVAIAIVAYVKLLSEHNGAFRTTEISIGYVGSVMEYFGSLRSTILEFVNGCSTVSELEISVKLESVIESSLVGTAIAAASQCARSR